MSGIGIKRTIYIFIVLCIFPSDLSVVIFFSSEISQTTFSHRNRTTISGKACLGILMAITLSSLHIQALLDSIWLSFYEETREKVHLTAFAIGAFRVRVHFDPD